MHDPMTLAFQIRNPLVRRDRHGYRPSVIDIWHVDPEKNGTDDSCDWFGRHRPLNEAEKALREAIYDAEGVFHNRPYYEAPAGSDLDRGHAAFQAIYQAKWAWLNRTGRRWHPRWHVHHWRIRVVPYLHFLRWAFTRCAKCGGRFRWGETGIGRWDDTGPGWFRSEYLEHMNHGNGPMTTTRLDDGWTSEGTDASD